MHQIKKWISPSLIALTALSISGCGGGSTSAFSGTNTGKFSQLNLVSDVAGRAAVTDPNLVNPWGISFSPSGPFWISDNGTGLSTLYNGSGAIQGLVVPIPAAGGGSNGPVSGQIFNSTSDFVIPSSTKALFIFDNEDGVITAWNGAAGAVAVVDRSGSGAVYKGLALAASGGANFLYAANFNSGSVDVFDKNFAFVKSFTDPSVPTGYAPFGIATINGLLYVTFARQDSAKHDDVAGAGNGYVDVFNPDGSLAQHLVARGSLNSPWGLALAPSGFGNVGGQLLVGNFGDGKINAYDITTGKLTGALTDKNANYIVIDGLWGLSFGNGGSAGSTSVLYFTAGSQHESHGLFGSISSTP